jgi:putative transposase
MPRPKRTWIPNRYYHIVCRGNLHYFNRPLDFIAFFQILIQTCDNFPFELASYCLMNNHYHLQMRSKETSLSKVMSLINKRYANYYNTRYRLTGHIFEKRFYDKIIEDKKGMLEVSRYIHLNPVEAKMVKHPENYKWSSFYLFKYPHSKQPNFMNIDSILFFFPGKDPQQKLSYCQYIDDNEG